MGSCAWQSGPETADETVSLQDRSGCLTPIRAMFALARTRTRSMSAQTHDLSERSEAGRYKAQPSQLTTHNSQLATLNSQLTTHNSHL